MEEKSLLKRIFGSSPKTTIMGYVAAIGTAIYPFLTNEGFDFKTDWKNLLIAVALGVWGRIQKDTNGVTAKEGKTVVKTALKENSLKSV